MANNRVTKREKMTSVCFGLVLVCRGEKNVLNKIIPGFEQN